MFCLMRLNKHQAHKKTEVHPTPFVDVYCIHTYIIKLVIANIKMLQIQNEYIQNSYFQNQAHSIQCNM